MASPHDTQIAYGEHTLSIEEETKETNLMILKRAQWLRAAILGANDGLLSTTSLMLGVGAAKEDQRSMLLSGLAGAVAGACSMAVGEYVSVSTQRDIEAKTKIFIDKNEKNNEGDVKLEIAGPNPANLIGSPNVTPLRSFACKRIIDSPVSVYSPKSPVMKVMDSDSKRAKSENDEIIVTETNVEMLPNPYKAAAASALSFLFGSLFPLIPAMLVKDDKTRILMIIVVTSFALVLFGGVGAYLGGSSVKVSSLRVLLGRWISMAITYGLLKPLDKDRKGNDSD